LNRKKTRGSLKIFEQLKKKKRKGKKKRREEAEGSDFELRRTA